MSPLNYERVCFIADYEKALTVTEQQLLNKLCTLGEHNCIVLSPMDE